MAEKKENARTIKTKEDILEIIPEVTLQPHGDFTIKKELIKDYEIIDAHIHTLYGLYGNLPFFLRAPYTGPERSLFSLSSYTCTLSEFDFNRVGFRSWTENIYSRKWIKIFIDLTEVVSEWREKSQIEVLHQRILKASTYRKS